MDNKAETLPYKRIEQIGDATLYLGDCLDILPTLGKVDAVITDPPYGMEFLSNHRMIKHKKIQNDSCNSMLKYACNIQVNHSKYIFCRWDNLSEIPKPKSLITWVKNNWSMGDLKHEHGRQTESIVYWPGEGHEWPEERPRDVIFSQRTKNEEHPTEKPIYLIEQIAKWTIGEILDPFMGSGTTGVACMNLGRKFIGIEIEEKYFDIACERIDQAQRQGRLFD